MKRFISAPRAYRQGIKLDDKLSEVSGITRFRLAAKPFDLGVLQSVAAIQREKGSLFANPNQESMRGYASRKKIAAKMGYTLTKALSRRIRKALVFLRDDGHLRFWDVNEIGNEKGATRIVISLASLVIRMIPAASGKLSRTLCPGVKALGTSSRTHEGEKPGGGLGLRQRLMKMGLPVPEFVPA